MQIVIDQERCKECGLCVSVCPKKILAFSNDFNQGGFHPVQVTDAEKCIKCGFCVLMCPDLALELKEVSNNG